MELSPIKGKRVTVSHCQNINSRTVMPLYSGEGNATVEAGKAEETPGLSD